MKQFMKDTKICWGLCGLVGKIFVAITAPFFI